MGCRFQLALAWSAAVALTGVASAQPATRIGYINFDNDPPSNTARCVRINCNGLMFCVFLAMPLTDDDVRNQVSNALSTPSATGERLTVVNFGDTSLLVVNEVTASGSTVPIDNLDVFSDVENVVVLDALVPVPALFVDIDEAGNNPDGTHGVSTFTLNATVSSNVQFMVSCADCTDNAVADQLENLILGTPTGSFGVIRNGFGARGSSGMVVTGLSLDSPVVLGGVTASDPNGVVGGFAVIPPSIQNFDPTLLSATAGGSLCVQGNKFDPGVQLLLGGVDITADPNNVVSVDPNTIRVNVPADPNRPAGPVDIEVRNPDGLTHRLVRQFEYLGVAGVADPCRAGNVLASSSECPAEVLFVNGVTGRPRREVTVLVNQFTRIEVRTPPGRASSGFALFAWGGAPTGSPFPQSFGGDNFGNMCRRTPLNVMTSGRLPVRCFFHEPNSSPPLLFPNEFRCIAPPPPPTNCVRSISIMSPTPFQAQKRFQNAGVTFYLQGFVEDDTAPTTTRHLSITNGIVLRVVQ